ncbi:MAG TPA: sulfur carrier protein ThiS [Gemmatimonadales bacterium]|jgi:thiamine biosynthesis protein ThiS|nr:sulfur carrier protein ThiS [Gemmatimonadales bacterium]
MMEMDIVVNGEPRKVAERASLLDLLATLGLDPRTVVVELNREIVRRPRLGETMLAAGDAVELVHFVGGG